MDSYSVVTSGEDLETLDGEPAELTDEEREWLTRPEDDDDE